MILVDANVLFHAIYPEGPEHRACRKLLEQWSEIGRASCRERVYVLV